MTRRELSRSIRWPKLLQPSPTSETRRPDLPRLRKIMWAPYLTRRSRSHALPPETTVRSCRTRTSPNVLLLDSCHPGIPGKQETKVVHRPEGKGMLHPIRATARLIDQKIGWNRIGLALSLVIIVSAAVVLYR